MGSDIAIVSGCKFSLFTIWKSCMQ
jgi:hypothetical protein